MQWAYRTEALLWLLRDFAKLLGGRGAQGDKQHKFVAWPEGSGVGGSKAVAYSAYFNT